MAQKAINAAGRLQFETATANRHGAAGGAKDITVRGGGVARFSACLTPKNVPPFGQNRPFPTVPGQGTGWTLGEAFGIDDRGDICFKVSSPASGNNQACLLVPTPEPSALLLAVAGLAGVAAYAWRKRK
jgi:hypothetical protein